MSKEMSKKFEVDQQRIHEDTYRQTELKYYIEMISNG